MNPKTTLTLLILLLLTACAAPAAPNATATPSSLTLPTPVLSATALPTDIAAPAQPTPTLAVSDPTAPTFHNLRFVTSPDAAPQPHFPQGAEQIFAIWDYANIPAKATVRRVWEFNGEPWLDREEAWAGAASGTVRDVSVYNFTGGGLEPGKYEVWLHLDSVVLANGRFWVNAASEPLSVPSPNGALVAQRLGDRSLVLTQPVNLLTDLATTDHPISEIVWLPSGDKLLIVTQDTTEQIAPSTLGIRHALWLVDAATGHTEPLGSYDEDLHEVGVSPNGRFLSLISGSGYGDACMVDRTLAIMSLDEQGNRLSVLSETQFAGLPQENAAGMYQLYPVDNGRWTANNQFEIAIAATCLLETDNPTLPGLYQINPTTLQAERIGSLPPTP